MVKSCLSFSSPPVGAQGCPMGQGFLDQPGVRGWASEGCQALEICVQIFVKGARFAGAAFQPRTVRTANSRLRYEH